MVHLQCIHPLAVVAVVVKIEVEVTHNGEIAEAARAEEGEDVGVVGGVEEGERVRDHRILQMCLLEITRATVKVEATLKRVVKEERSTPQNLRTLTISNPKMGEDAVQVGKGNDAIHGLGE